MDIVVVQYVAFIVAALILIWAVIEINKRLYRRDKSNRGSTNDWVELDTRNPEARKELLAGDRPTTREEVESDSEADVRMRSKQNGHHLEIPNPPL